MEGDSPIRNWTALTRAKRGIIIVGMKSLWFGRVWVMLAMTLAMPLAAPAADQLPHTNLLVYHNRRGEVEPVKSRADWQKRRAEILLAMQGRSRASLPGKAKRCSLDVKVEEEVDCGTYVRRFLTYSSEPGSRVTAYLCIPKEALAGKK